MSKSWLRILSTWPFILCLTLLISNDWCFKVAYPGVITGKLSDFAGIAVVALLLFTLYPRRLVVVGLSISLAFLWWKSPASDWAIQTFNALDLYRIGRVQDYSDLLALLVIPLCHTIANNPSQFSLPWPRLRQWLTPPVAVITLFGIMGTSSMPTQQNYYIKTSTPSEPLPREQIVEVIQAVAQDFHLSCFDCVHPNQSGRYSKDRLTLTYHFNENGAVEFSVSSYAEGITSFSASGEERANELRAALKKELGKRWPNLEYVEPLTRSSQ